MKDVSNKAETSSRNMMFVCEKMNWGEICFGTGKWLSTKWTVYTDKTLVKKTKYDKCRFINTDEKIYLNNTLLNDSDFNRLKIWSQEVFPHLKASQGCDGEGWKITSFNDAGNINYTICGYIYGIEDFNLLLEILDK